MEITKEVSPRPLSDRELSSLLRSLEIALPAAPPKPIHNTNMMKAALSKALGIAQDLEYFDIKGKGRSNPLDPRMMMLLPAETRLADAFSSTQVFSTFEILSGGLAASGNASFELRTLLQSMMTQIETAMQNMDKNKVRVIVQDPDQSLALLIEIHNLRLANHKETKEGEEADNDDEDNDEGAGAAKRETFPSTNSCPFLEVRYMIGTKEMMSKPKGKKQLEVVMSWMKEGNVVNGKADTLDEVLLLKEMLEHNNSRLSKDYCIEVEGSGSGSKGQPGSGSFKTSFIVPIRPVLPEKRVMLSVGTCFECGKLGSKSVCSRCGEARYCSKEHQAAHWKVHKQSCKERCKSAGNQQASGQAAVAASKIREIPSGRKVEVDLSKPPAGFAGQFFSSVSNQASTRRAVQTSSRLGDSLPPNVHGQELFMVKVQRGGKDDPAMVYDQRRSFTFLVSPEQNAFRGLMETVASSPLMKRGLPKVYLWAKRESENILHIFIDAIPDQDVPW